MFDRLSYRAAVALMLLAMPLPGQEVDRGWFEKQMAEELERHRTLVPAEGGFLHADFGGAWQKLEAPYASLVSQTRQLHVQSVGFRITGKPEFQDNVRAGADFLLDKFADPVHGGWYHRVSPSGEIVSDKKDAYSFAFVIYGCVSAWRATGQTRYLNAAKETWRTMKRRLRDGEVFIKPRTTRDFAKTLGTNSQNPIMHLFEALLELYDATGSQEIRADAKELADAVLGQLVRPREGYLPELFGGDWKPLAIEDGGRVEVGHQFEWAWLLSRAVDLGLPESYLAAGHRLLDNGLAGYDRERGGIYSRMDYNRTIIEYRQGKWEQCEFLRAVLRYARQHGRSELWGRYRQTMAHVRESFIDEEFGGWRWAWYPDRALTGRELRKSNEWMSGYHVVNFYLEALGMCPGWSSSR